MPPRRFKKKSVRKIVEKRVAKAIEKYEKTRADSNNTGGSGSTNTGGTVVPEMHGCSYKTFMNGKPHSFKGTEGVVGLKRWFEKMEQVFEICKCAEDDKVKFAMCTFEGRALTWWNGNTLNLKGVDIEAYNNHFHELALMCHELVPTEKKKKRRVLFDQVTHHGEHPCSLSERHVVNCDGIYVDPNMVESVKNWKTLESSTEIRSFLGLAGYYQRFIENFSKIAKPLTLLTQKNKAYVWGDKQDEAFQILKEKLCNAPVLALPDGPDDFVVYCDASKQEDLKYVQRGGSSYSVTTRSEIKLPTQKANVVADALSRKERLKPRRVRAMSITIHSGLKTKILEAQSEASKDLKAPTEWLIKED
ncbi:putative reverse transcriptase domain-containing protein [Tanacetum coccineum]